MEFPWQDLLSNFHVLRCSGVDPIWSYDRYFIPLFAGFYTCQVVQDFFHQQYLLFLGYNWREFANLHVWMWYGSSRQANLLVAWIFQYHIYEISSFDSWLAISCSLAWSACSLHDNDHVTYGLRVHCVLPTSDSMSTSTTRDVISQVQ